LLGDLTSLLDQELNHPNPKAAELAEFLALSLGSFQTLKAQATSGRTPDPIDTLARALEPTQPEKVRVAAAVSLSRQAERTQGNLPSALLALIRATESGDAPIRARAAYALGYFYEPKAADALARLVEQEDRAVRFNAAAALGRLGDSRARRTLREMLSPADLAGLTQGESASESKTRMESIELEAVWALQSAVKANRPALAQSLRKDLEDLSTTSSPNVRVEVMDLLKSLPAVR
jgi:HEAT repeat protein